MPSPDACQVLDFTNGGTLPPALLRRLDTLATEKREAYNAMIDGLSAERGRDIDWWVSLPASRNTHTGLLFGKCIQLALVRSLMEEGGDFSVRTDDQALARVLKSVLKPSRIVLVQGPSRLRMMARNIASSLFHAFSAGLAARCTRHLARSLPDRPGLLEVYVQRDSFDAGGFRDRYYPGFWESLDDKLRARLYYLPVFHRIRDYAGLFRHLRQVPQNFLLREDYLRWSDYVFAFGHWWRARRLKGATATFAGFQVGALLDAELDQSRFANATIQALLAYRFWCHRAAFTDATLMDWHEGHGIDHATAAAIRWHGGGTRLIAMRPIAPDTYLSLMPTRGEIRAESVAREWAVIGADRREDMRRAFPMLEISPAPGLRHRELLVAGILPRAELANSVLIVLSMEGTFVDRVASLLRQVPVGSGFQWLIKRHPAMPREEAERRLQDVVGVSFVDGSFQEAMGRVSVVAGLGTNTLIEAAALGLPIICLAGGNMPAELPFAAAEPVWWRVAYDAQELVAAVREVGGAPAEPVQARMDQLLGPFEPAILARALLTPADYQR